MRPPAVLPLLLVLALASPFASSAAGATTRDAHFDSVLRGDDPAAQEALARQFEHGSGVSRDYRRAVQLYCQSARSGNLRAGYALGWMYMVGRGVRRDDALAANWMAWVARSGDEHAARNLERLGARKSDLASPARLGCTMPDGTAVPLPLRGEKRPSREQIEQWVRWHAPLHGLDAELVLAVIAQESNFNARARSHANARGLMQLIPATAKRFGVRDVHDPEQNMRGGMTYLRWLIDHFEGDVRLALAGYNAGEGAVRRFNGVPPYRETRDYVRKIAARAKAAGVSLGPS